MSELRGWCLDVRAASISAELLATGLPARRLDGLQAVIITERTELWAESPHIQTVRKLAAVTELRGDISVVRTIQDVLQPRDGFDVSRIAPEIQRAEVNRRWWLLDPAGGLPVSKWHEIGDFLRLMRSLNHAEFHRISCWQRVGQAHTRLADEVITDRSPLDLPQRWAITDTEEQAEFYSLLGMDVMYIGKQYDRPAHGASGRFFFIGEQPSAGMLRAIQAAVLAHKA